MDPNIKQSIVDRLKQTNNVLVTVKKSPNIDQLAACIGLTLFLNKQGKHATAVYSGETPPTIEFLKPDHTLEKDTNSLRDFIISLDKSKADKLRYKVEDKVVKIFITPYRTSLSQDDLEFSQGDFNVDVVVALGVHGREELDQAIMAYGRILHDATIISINNNKLADLGALNWNDPKASSLSEMVTGIVEGLQPNGLDAQIATAFLTGIVAETERFSNTKTTSVTMSTSAKLMTAGANQQLVATKLEEPAPEPPKSDQPANVTGGEDGALEINHPKKEEHSNAGLNTEGQPAGANKVASQNSKSQKDIPLPLPASDGNYGDSEIHIDDQGNFKTGLQDEGETTEKDSTSKPADDSKPSRLALDPPTLGGPLTANTVANQLSPSVDPLSGKSPNSKIIERDEPASIAAPDESLVTKSTVAGKLDIKPDQTLSSIEEQVRSSHVDKDPHKNVLSSALSSTPDVNRLIDSPNGNVGTPLPQAVEQANSVGDDGLNDARQAVEAATYDSATQQLEPIQGLGAQPFSGDLASQPLAEQPVASPSPASSSFAPSNTFTDSPIVPPSLVPPSQSLPQEQSASSLPPTAPPPVPPPMMPPSF